MEDVRIRDDLPIIKRAIGDTAVETVNARQVHVAVQSGQEFATWIKRRLKSCNAKENKDFVEVFDKSIKNSKGGRPIREYYLTIDMAKHIAMLERNEIGYEVRQYFITFERKAKDRLIKLLKERPRIEDLPRKTVLELALAAEHELEAEKQRTAALKKEIEEISPKAAAYDAFMDADGNYSISNAAKILGFGPRKLFNLLRDKKILFKRGSLNLPYQPYIERGFFEVRATSTGQFRTSQTVVTPDGLVFLQQKIAREEYVVKNGS